MLTRGQYINNRYGEPIQLEVSDLEGFQKEPKTTVKKLTAEIAQGVEQGTINSPDW